MTDGALTKRRPPRPQWQERDESKQHQIRFMQSPFKGGLGIAVSCVCTRRTRSGYGKLRPLVDRSSESPEDSWEIYEDHLPLTYDGFS